MNSLLSLALLTLSLPAFASMKPTHLKCEYLDNPLGIDARPPRLSWILESNRRGEKQSAYRILVASSEAALRSNRGDLWDSRRIEGNRQLGIAYAGEPLRSGQRCWWKVCAWDRDGKAEWSAAAWWEMGLLDNSDWHGQWIGRTTDTSNHPSPMLRRDFTVNGKVKRARAYICGLGYYELRLNGRKVGDHVLDPGYTRYDRRALYVTYDVTKELKQGANAVGAMLGTGWYNTHTKAVWYFDKAPWRAGPKLLMELRIEYANGQTQNIFTGPDWRTSTGPIIYDSIYGGETYDARLEKPGWDTAGYDVSSWEAAKIVPEPGGSLAAQTAQPIRIHETITPVAVTEPKPGVYIIDMGQNLAGHAQLAVDAPAGTRIQMRYGEKLHKDGTLDTSNIDIFVKQADPKQQFQTDTYIARGGGLETWEARFCYHGFQYVEVTGIKPTLDTLRGRFVYSSVEPAGEFECSNEMLNRIQRATRYSYLSNLESIPTDCPTREKNGWTGDAQLACEQGLFNFHSLPIYEKWMNDLDDEMRPTGELPGIVPSSGWGYEWGNGPAWDSAFILIPWYLYEYCGDTRVLVSHYPKMKRYVDYLTSKADHGIISIGLGDWVPWKTETPISVTSTAYYSRDALVVASAAEVLGKSDEARQYRDLAEKIRRSFTEKFVDSKTGNVANGSQTALSCALYQDMLDDTVKPFTLTNLLAVIEKGGGHIDAGILGAKYVLNALLEHNRVDVAYKIASQETQPGWGWWLSQGATTLWEDWQGTSSRNHIMFGDISAWLYKAIAGIRPDPNAPGFGHFIIRPCNIAGPSFARAAYESVRGRIAVDWRLKHNALELEIEIPANTSATVFVPSSDGNLRESGKDAARAVGVRFIRRDPAYMVFEVSSGRYHFQSFTGI